MVVIGSPLYWHNICGAVRNVLDRFYGLVKTDEFSGRQLYFLFQGASPEKTVDQCGLQFFQNQEIPAGEGEMISCLHSGKAFSFAGRTVVGFRGFMP